MKSGGKVEEETKSGEVEKAEARRFPRDLLCFASLLFLLFLARLDEGILLPLNIAFLCMLLLQVQ